MTAHIQLQPWELASDPPIGRGADEQVDYALRCAILAPSSHNTQPWLFKVGGTGVELLADRSRALPVVDPTHRELIMSCGAALLHLRVALSASGRMAQVERMPAGANPDLLARVELGPSTDPSLADAELLRAMRGRRTNRGAFWHEAISPAIGHRLVRAAADEGAQLALIRDARAKRRIASVVADADRRQWDNPRFRTELATWMRSNATRRGDGIPGYGFGEGRLESLASPLAVRAFDLGGGRAAQDSELATEAPALAVILTDWDGPAEWLAAGEAVGHVLLECETEGLSVSYLNQPIEERATWPHLRRLLGERGFPQLLLRIGYPRHQARPTPRRPLEDVLL